MFWQVVSVGIWADGGGKRARGDGRVTRQTERVIFPDFPSQPLRQHAARINYNNPEYSWNGDYQQTRFEAKSDAVITVFRTKINSNPENSRNHDNGWKWV